ncbi:MAG: hypothetical protein L6416_04635, partial [Candidatus Omnitrophica bacterium]|nr:hypothetical protein [Candidatus Omnitrophota bacterium]
KKYKTEIDEIKQRKKESGRIKKISIYVLRRLTGLTNKDIGQIFGMRYSAVSKAGMSMEKTIEEDRKLKDEVNEIISIFEV